MKIDVSGIPFELEQVAAEFAGEDRFGRCDELGAKIWINKSCSKEQFQATLIHEWIHGVAGCYGVDGNEAMVSVIAQELYRKGFRVEVIDE